MPNHGHQLLYAGLDVGALILALGAFWSILPGIAVLFAIGWYCLMLWESATVQRWLGQNRAIEICEVCHREIRVPMSHPRHDPGTPAG